MKKSFLKRVSLFAAAALMMLMGTPLMGQVQTTKLKGTVVQDGETVPFATVKIYQDKKLVMGTNTNAEGFYEILNMTPGTYDLEVWFDQKAIAEMSEVTVFTGKYKTVNFAITEMEDEIIYGKVDNPMMDLDVVSSGAFVGRKQITDMGIRQVDDIVRTLAGVNTVSERDPLKIRGARAGATAFYIDGVKVIGSSSLPNAMIEQVNVITGGIPAEFGDVTGGVISVTTRNTGMRPQMGRAPVRKTRKVKRKKSTEEDSSGFDFELDPNMYVVL